MRRTTAVILVLCVAAIAHAASVQRPQSWYAKKRAGSDDDVAQIASKWIPTMIAKKFHPAPEPDESHATPTKRKQVGCKISIVRFQLDITSAVNCYECPSFCVPSNICSTTK